MGAVRSIEQRVCGRVSNVPIGSPQSNLPILSWMGTWNNRPCRAMVPFRPCWPCRNQAVNRGDVKITSFRLRSLGPVVLIALCLAILCAVTDNSLLRQQTTITQIFRENVESRRAAVEL